MSKNITNLKQKNPNLSNRVSRLIFKVHITYENNNPISFLLLPPKFEQNIEFPLRLIEVDIEIVLLDTVVFISKYFLLFSFHLNTLQI
jgi:hypothetical protein